MKILVTGANGDVGRSLVPLILNEGYKVVANFRKSKKYFKRHKNLFFLKHNFENECKKRMKFDIIINCIATHKFSKKKKLHDFFNSNILSLYNVKKYGIYNNVKLIINLSTISVYGDITVNKLKEVYEPVNQNKLGLTKFIGEKILDNSICFVNLRLPGVITPSKNNKRPWLKNIAYKIKKNQKIELFNLNCDFNSLIDSYEIIRLMKHLIDIGLNNIKLNNTFNLAASKPMKLKVIIHFIKEKFASKSKIFIKNYKVKSFIIDNSKIMKILKFYPSSVNEILSRSLL